jgi:ADP-ribosylglycohydrolase
MASEHVLLLGAIAGDIIGSRFEWHPVKSKDFQLRHESCFFTDDSILTVATAHALLHQEDFAMTLWNYGNHFPHGGYGGHFRMWLSSTERQPYNSFGNGSAMRVSPVGWAFNTKELVLKYAELSAAVTHNHPEGVKGAQATALAICMARQGASKEEIKHEIEGRFGYDLQRTLEQIRPNYRFDVTCQGSVPEAIIAFLEAEDFEDALRNAISLGGDADTQAAISGSIAEAYFGEVPIDIAKFVKKRIPAQFWQVIEEFNLKFIA